MKKYLAIYQATPGKIQEWMSVSEEDRKSEMEEWTAWMETHKNELVDEGSPLGKNMRVSKNGITEEANTICGHSLARADSHEEAAKIFADNPHVKEDGVWIDVLEVVEM